MVEYTDWTEIGHAVYKAKGGTYGEGTAVDVTEVLAAYWSQNKDRLSAMSRAEARRLAEQEIQVRG